jgi:hypothetical protein
MEIREYNKPANNPPFSNKRAQRARDGNRAIR